MLNLHVYPYIGNRDIRTIKEIEIINLLKIPEKEGIYEKAYPDWGGWGIIKMHIKEYGNKRASEFCYKDRNLTDLVEDFYKKNFWDKMGLDDVFPYRTADLMFKFAVNVGINRAVRYTQDVVGVSAVGIAGRNTLKALNSYNPMKFEVEYKDKFERYYKRLADNNPTRYAHFLNGWLNRVKIS
ncbi:peptidoglycan domain protein [Campylobacter sp. FMV-PI01]|uniref:Peptidoglycan domain protein n=2 Tax=Campylobacter portucalensis TaxID=2608384 RepID=A0A6L5WKT2_9BACT|nr:peptidoglycan domain protein [Campylobacter portucalensis]